MRGHNRPPFPPKVPGTESRSWDVPTAIIYRPARSAMTSAPRPNYWILEFEPWRPLRIEPLMGYTSSDDPYRSIRLKFPDRQSAVAFAEQNDWRYIVREDAPVRARHNRWRGTERHQLYKGADAQGAFRINAGQKPGRSDHSLQRAVERDGAVDLSVPVQTDFDPVLEAGLELSWRPIRRYGRV